MAKRAAADWMPLKAAVDRGVEFTGSADDALADIESRLHSGEIAGATRLPGDAAPVPRKKKFWAGWEFWILPDKHGSYHVVPDPPDPPDPAMADVHILVLRGDVMKLLPDPATPADAASGRRRGRPQEYDWEIFAVEVTRRALANGPSGKPKTGRGLVSEMTAWCLVNWGSEPADSVLREHINTVLKHLNK